jgi:hypothetical protein
MRLLILLTLLVSTRMGEAGEALFTGLVLNDHLGQPHDLGKETPDHLVLLFTIACRVDAKAWDEGLSPYLPVGKPLVRIMDLGEVGAEDRARVVERVTKALDGTGVLFVMDWEGAVRKRLGGSPDQALIVAIDGEGKELGRVTGLPTAKNRTTALGFVRIVPHPPLIDDVTPNPKTDPRRQP